MAPAMVDPLQPTSFPAEAVPSRLRNDAWLASRWPAVPQYGTLSFGTFGDATAQNQNYPFWSTITAPFSSLGGTFEAPMVSGGTITTYTQHTFYTTNVPGVSGRIEPGMLKGFPAFKGVEVAGIARDVVAGDADGDGVADCGLQKLPIGELNGLTYYVGIRIIDNNSAINVNTAMRRDRDYSGDGAAVPATGFFASNVGLAELLRTAPAKPLDTVEFPSESFLTVNGLGEEMNALLKYRLGIPTGNSIAMPAGVIIAPDPDRRQPATG
jgi:hypothetical protein